ncbi:MAG: hypothetical protein RL720_47 [Actinomycetota bacterium]|jgi:uncharacterized membrane protein
MQRRRIGSWIVIALFAASGVLHLVTPGGFLWLMPPELSETTNLVLIYASGVVELLCALGLLQRWPWAPMLTVLTLLAVWPANIWYAFDQLGSDNTALVIASWVRLPLQIPLLWWAWKSPVKAQN